MVLISKEQKGDYYENHVLAHVNDEQSKLSICIKQTITSMKSIQTKLFRYKPVPCLNYDSVSKYLFVYFSSDMSTVARHKRGSARIVLERKCRFLGRFYAKELSEANLSRLRNHIRYQFHYVFRSIHRNTFSGN